MYFIPEDEPTDAERKCADTIERLTAERDALLVRLEALEAGFIADANDPSMWQDPREYCCSAYKARLLVALHDAIRHPMGVVPDSANEFYNG